MKKSSMSNPCPEVARMMQELIDSGKFENEKDVIAAGVFYVYNLSSQLNSIQSLQEVLLLKVNNNISELEKKIKSFEKDVKNEFFN